MAVDFLVGQDLALRELEPFADRGELLVEEFGALPDQLLEDIELYFGMTGIEWKLGASEPQVLFLGLRLARLLVVKMIADFH